MLRLPQIRKKIPQPFGRGNVVVATGLEEINGVFSRYNRIKKRRIYNGFLTIAHNEIQAFTTRVGVRVGVSVGVRKTRCITLLSVRFSWQLNTERGFTRVGYMNNIRQQANETVFQELIST